MKLFIGGEMGPWPEKLDKIIDTQKLHIHHSTIKPLEEYLKNKNYGSGLKDLGVIPMCFKPGWMEHYKERQLYRPAKGEADYRLRIDYNAFVNGNEEEKRKLILMNIIQVIRLLDIKIKKYKLEFDANKMEEDIREFLNFKDEV